DFLCEFFLCETLCSLWLRSSKANHREHGVSQRNCHRGNLLPLYCPFMSSLQKSIESIIASGAADSSARQTFLEFRDALTSGKIRAAEKLNGKWTVNAWVKQGILLGFKLGELAEMGGKDGLSFVDKDTFPARHFSVADRVRVVPGGSSVRAGSYVSPSVI